MEDRLDTNYNCELPPSYKTWNHLYAEVIEKGLEQEEEIVLIIQDVHSLFREFKVFRNNQYRFVFTQDYLKARIWDEFWGSPYLTPEEINALRKLTWEAYGSSKNPLEEKLNGLMKVAIEKSRLFKAKLEAKR